MDNRMEETKEHFRSIFVQKIKDFYDNESQLLNDDVGERALVFRIGCRLYNVFPGCSVYCEYNKAHGDNETTSKSIPGKIHTYPDLIIFSDTETGSAANKIVVEVKKETNCDKLKNDVDKLRWFTDPSYKYRYETGYHLILGKLYFILCLYERGQLISIDKYDKISDQWNSSHAENFIYINVKDLMGAQYE